MHELCADQADVTLISDNYLVTAVARISSYKLVVRSLEPKQTNTLLHALCNTSSPATIIIECTAGGRKRGHVLRRARGGENLGRMSGCFDVCKLIASFLLRERERLADMC